MYKMHASDLVSGFDSCGICGSDEVRIDVVDPFGDGSSLLLGECPRCQHRFTDRLVDAQPVLPIAAFPKRLGALPEAA